MYYGLRTGSGAQLPTISALLGYLIFMAFARLGFASLSKAENVLIVSVATATGCMPSAAGFTEFIPALEYVLNASDGGSVLLGWSDMITWALGLSFFGILFAVFLRDRLILSAPWPWPGATASANVIRALHSGKEVPVTTNHWGNTPSQDMAGVMYGTVDNEPLLPSKSNGLPANLNLVLSSAGYSAVFVSFF